MPSGHHNALPTQGGPVAALPAGGGAAAQIGQRLVALFALALLLLNFPLLSLWDQPVSVLGLPLFPLALFVTWAALIAALAWLMERLPD